MGKNKILDFAKEQRKKNWEKFNNTSSEEKLIILDYIVSNKDKKLLAKCLDFKGDCFDVRIFELISKTQSTANNYFRLMLAFPEYVELWEEWQGTENEEDFFKKYKEDN